MTPCIVPGHRDCNITNCPGNCPTRENFDIFLTRTVTDSKDSGLLIISQMVLLSTGMTNWFARSNTHLTARFNPLADAGFIKVIIK